MECVVYLLTRVPNIREPHLLQELPPTYRFRSAAYFFLRYLIFYPFMLLSHLKSHILFGANTDVGKTIFAAALVRAAANITPAMISSSNAATHPHVHYLKPVSTGPARDADYR